MAAALHPSTAAATHSDNSLQRSPTLSLSSTSLTYSPDWEKASRLEILIDWVCLKIRQTTPPEYRRSDEAIRSEFALLVANLPHRQQFFRRFFIDFDTYCVPDIHPSFQVLWRDEDEVFQFSVTARASLTTPPPPHIQESHSSGYCVSPVHEPPKCITHPVDLNDLRDSNPVTTLIEAIDRLCDYFEHYVDVENSAAPRVRIGVTDINILRCRGYCDWVKIMSSSSGTPESWISSFCSLLGHEYFAEISEDFIEDDFNLTGLQTQVSMYKEALEMILDVEPEEDDDEDEDEEEEEGDESIEGEGRTSRNRAAAERRHHRMASDLSIIESSAEMLYGLIHQRFICSRAGIQQMSEKYELAHFGVCPRTFCDQVRTLPVGLSDVPGEDTVKLFCPSCLDVYVPPNSRFQTVDGAFFGRTFGALFLLTFPDYDISKKGAETLAAGRQMPAVQSPDSEEREKINGFNAHNLAPGLGRGKVYEPKIYGFKVSERARSGPRMSWLRKRPINISELDEAVIHATEHGEESDEDAGVHGAPTTLRRQPRPRPNGSPMSVEANGEVYV